MEYIESYGGIGVNVFIVCIFGLAAYSSYAKKWSAMTGHYFTDGHITWSEYVTYGITTSNSEQALVSYSYDVNGTLYNGVLNLPLFGKRQFVEKHPKGSSIKIFYSVRYPDFSRAIKPATHLDVIGASFLIYFLLPFMLINIPSIYFFWLVSINK